MPDQSERETEKKERFQQLINYGVPLLGAGASAAVSSTLGLIGPEGAVVGGIVGKGIEIALSKVGQDISERHLSTREKVRIGAVLVNASEEIRKRRKSGESLREDGFFDEKQTGRSDAEEVAESVFLKAQREPEEKKIQYMGYLISSIAFDSEINVHMAHQLTKAAEQLTYRQLCILKLSVVKDNFELHDKDYRGQGTLAQELYPLLYEYMDLYRKDFIIFGIGFSSISSLADINPGLADVQGIGVDLYNLMKLCLIPDEDITPIAEHLKSSTLADNTF